MHIKQNNRTAGKYDDAVVQYKISKCKLELAQHKNMSSLLYVVAQHCTGVSLFSSDIVSTSWLCSSSLCTQGV